MSGVSRGNAFDVVVAKAMRAMGFTVGSRRHIGGAGDLLGVHPDGRVWLVECKNRKHPFQGFRREDRRAMMETPLPPGAERFLAYRDGEEIKWLGSAEWPPYE